MDPSSSKIRGKTRSALERLRALWSSSTLPAVPTQELARQEQPTMVTLRSSQGAKTHLSIERLEPNSSRVAELSRFCAVQNTDEGARHTLEYDFIVTQAGQLSIEGKVFELGATSKLPNTTVSFTKTLLMEFFLSTDQEELKDATRVRQAAFKLCEAFADEGCLGLDTCVDEVIASSTSNLDWKLYGERMGQDVEVAIGGEDNDERHGERAGSLHHFTAVESEYLERIYEALLVIDDLSIEQYQALYNQGVVTNSTVSLQNELKPADAEEESSTRIKQGALSRATPFSRVWLNLFSPHVEPSDSVVVSLQLPFSRVPKSASLSNLVIEVRTPRSKLFFREKYRVKDSNNVLAIDRYSNNDDFFRNLFRELHAVNHSEFEDARKTAHILELLAAYDLVAKPHGMLTRLSRAWSVASAFLTGIPA